MRLSTHRARIAALLLMLVGLSGVSVAQDEASLLSQEGSTISDILGFSKYLRLEPKTVSSTDGNESTVGLEYEYKRRFADYSDRGDMDLYFESSGFLAADEKESTDRQLDHKLRLHLIDIASGRRADDYETFKDPESEVVYRRLKAADRIYSEGVLKQIQVLYSNYRTADSDEQAEALLEEIRDLWPSDMGELTLDRAGRIVELEDYETKWAEKQDEFKKGVSLPWLSLEVNVGAESDQDFGNLQYVGGARFYGKWGKLGTPIDYLFKSIRGYERPHNFMNVQGGPYFWAGLDMIDASENEARKAITGNTDETFGRFSGGLYYRNELFDYGSEESPESVSVEVTWEYFAELDAPDSIKATNRDTTSYLSASVLFENGMFLEYKDGSKPLDLMDSSAISLGWRFGR